MVKEQQATVKIMFPIEFSNNDNKITVVTISFMSTLFLFPFI